MAILKKFIGNDQVGATKIRLENNLALRARNAAGSADVDLMKLDGADILTLLKLPRLDSGVGSPSDDNDLISKGYLDSLTGANSGIAELDSNGKVPLSQLPHSIMQYVGTWDADANSPSLADYADGAAAGVHIGDVYRVSVAGTQDLGSGNITFAVGDYAILNSGGKWEKSDSADITNATDLTYTQADIDDWTVAQNSTVSATLDEVGSRLSALEVGGGDTKQVKVSANDAAEGYIEDKIVGLSGKISISTLNNGGDEDLQITVGADIFDKVVNTTDDITEGSTKLFFTDSRARTAVITQVITNGVTDRAPSEDAVFDALALKFNSADFASSFTTQLATKSTTDLAEGTNLYFTDARAKLAAVADAISNGVTDVAPSQNAVFDALALKLDLAGGTMSGFLTLSADPSNNLHAATKQYVDNAVAGVNSAAEISFTPAGNLAAVTVQAALEELDTEKVAKAGDTMTGFLTLSADPTSGLHAATKQYVDSAVAGKDQASEITFAPAGNLVATNVQAAIEELDTEKLALAGGTMSGNIAMGGYAITGLLDPSSAQDAATKAYVDGQLDLVAAQQLVHQTITLAAGDITNGYVDVTDVIVGEPWVQVGRVSLVPTDDFTVGNNGASLRKRITFAGEVAAAGAEALADGDKLPIYYMKSVNPFV